MQPFFFDGRQVRVILGEQDAPWFVGKDVCEVLGISKYRDAVALLDSDERVSRIVDTLGGPQQMTTVSESGLYALIFTSRKPEARAFRKWVTGTVLPALRRTGRFDMARSPVRAPVSLAAMRIRPSARATVLTCAVRMAAQENGDMETVRQYFDAFCEMVGGGLPLPGQGCRIHYMDMADLFWQWADECLERDESGEVQAKNLYASFRGWCRESRRMEPPSMHVFGAWLGQHFRRRLSNVTYYQGLRLKGREA
ncbi:MAG: BRO family protein [Desulfovibrio sp.]